MTEGSQHQEDVTTLHEYSLKQSKETDNVKVCLGASIGNLWKVWQKLKKATEQAAKQQNIATCSEHSTSNCIF